MRHLKYEGKDFFEDDLDISFLRHENDNTCETHTHDFVELVYIREGKGTHTVAGKTYDVEKGNVLLINIGEEHSIGSIGIMSWTDIMLSPSFFGRELVNSENFFDIMKLSQFGEIAGEVFDNRCLKLSGADIISAEHLCDDMFSEWKNKKYGYKTALRGYMQVFIALVVRNVSGSDGEGGYSSRIPPEIIAYIDRNLSEKISVAELAERSFYNPAYFGRLFRDCYGKSLKDYITERRMKRAAELLAENMSVSDVAETVGYSSKSAFYKAFRDFTGENPNKFKKKHN